MEFTTVRMRAFRAAATLVDVIPTVRIRIRDGEHELCSVSRTPSDPEYEGLALAPCAFRSAVGRAYRLHRHGVRLRLLDMPPGDEPAIDIGLRAGDVVLPGQIYRVRTGDRRHLFLFMTELDVESSERAVADALATSKRCDQGERGAGANPSPRRVGFHADAVTDLTVVHTMSAVEDDVPAAEVMARLLEVCVAAEAITDLEAGSPAPWGA